MLYDTLTVKELESLISAKSKMEDVHTKKLQTKIQEAIGEDPPKKTD